MVRSEIEVEVNAMEDIFKREYRFEVPLYQRNYSWKHDEHVPEFWGDLIRHYEINSREKYFFGTLMLVNTSQSNNLYTIIDGQQRLTTSIMLLTAFRDYFLEINDQAEVDSLNSILLTKSDKMPRLTLNVYNKEYFETKILAEEKISKKIISLKTNPSIRTKDKLLRDAYCILAEKILQYRKGEPDQSKQLGKIKEHFLIYFTIVENIIEDLQKAYKIFENINNKGLHLAQSDLVKNHLFEIIDSESRADPKISDADRETLIREADDSWQNIIRILEIAKITESVYLRYYLTAFIELVGKDDVYSTIKNKYGTKERVQTFLVDLETRVSVLNSLAKPSFEDWNKDQTTVDQLSGLKSLGQGAMYPILLLGKEKFSVKDMKKLIILTTKLFFRAKTVCSRNFTDIEKLVDQICIRIRTDDNVKISDIQEMMFKWSQYPEDAEFLLKFRTLSLTDKRAHYALSEIHYQMNGGRAIQTQVINTKSQIEHIMPKIIKGTKWETEIKSKHGFSDIELDEYKKLYLDKLGNLTLLNNIKNIKNSNKSFLDKKTVYVDPLEIKMTTELATISEWDDDAILKRQNNFTDHAKIIWNLKSAI